eukprot:15438936-Alexandrium_andersonii.AAC.1
MRELTVLASRAHLGPQEFPADLVRELHPARSGRLASGFASVGLAFATALLALFATARRVVLATLALWPS